MKWFIAKLNTHSTGHGFKGWTKLFSLNLPESL